jgi:hypothetical protein
MTPNRKAKKGRDPEILQLNRRSLIKHTSRISSVKIKERGSPHEQYQEVVCILWVLITRLPPHGFAMQNAVENNLEEETTNVALKRWHAVVQGYMCQTGRV